MPNGFCYVIMPYGGEDEEKKERYRGVFEGLIQPAGVRAGYTEADVRRSDFTGEPGSIIGEVVRSLGEAEIVIADITEANPNVMYELGIRHVMRKTGTVLIKDQDDKTPVPFDIKDLRIVYYSSSQGIRGIAAVQTQIADAIAKQRESSAATDKADNPVHYQFRSLPANVLGTGSDELRRLNDRLVELQSERDRLQKQLSELAPTMTGDEFDVDALFEEANAARNISGETAYLRLTSKLESGSTEEFIEELRSILKSPYLSRGDFLRISRLCKRSGLDHHSRVVLEVARKQYPDDLDILIALADAYQSSPNPSHQANGRKLIEQFLNVEYGPDGPRMTKRPGGNVYSAAITLFNFYLANGNFAAVVSFAESLEEHMGQSNIAARNKARALHKLGNMELAGREFQRAIELAPNDDVTYNFYADYLDDDRRYGDAYEAYEKAITCDPRDGSLYMNLANHIMLRGYLRNADGKIVGPEPDLVRQRAAVPLYIKALDDSYRDLRASIVNALASNKMMPVAVAISNGETPEGDWDYSALMYIENLIGHSN